MSARSDLSIEVRFRGLTVSLDLERGDPSVGMGHAIHVTSVEVDNEDEVAEWWDGDDDRPRDKDWLEGKYLDELLEVAADQLDSIDGQGDYDG